MEHDNHWMQRALELAERGRGAVEPNPLVGAVVVHDGILVGEGWHQRYGGPHAEVHALEMAGPSARGATLYVTLEPCCHHGKTPPCTDAIVRAGIASVVAAMPDPFPLVAGRGTELLRAAGLTIVTGVLEDEARLLNAPYLALLTYKRPYIHLKWAMTLDGKIATRAGDSKWISNEASRRRVHELRGRVDGILVGIGTVLADDPSLTARPTGVRIASRIILDSKARLPLDSHLVKTTHEVPTIVVTAVPSDELKATGCEVLTLPDEHGRISLSSLLEELGRRRMTNLLIEGGADVLGSFLDAQLVDEVHVFLSPRLCGGRDALSCIGGVGVEHIAESLSLSRIRAEAIEGDLYLHGTRTP